jgi:hypothetical protein
MSIEAWEAAGKAFESGNIESCDDATLRGYLQAISNQQIQNGSIQHRDIVRGITLNHMLLQRHIDRLDRQNTKTQRWVMALAVASLMGTTAQAYYAANPPQPAARAEPAHLVPAKRPNNSSKPTPLRGAA